MKCYDCDKVYKGGKDWTFCKGRFSTYATCPKCYEKNAAQQVQPQGTVLVVR